MPTIHAFIQYFVYRWKAKGRHGTHSPFVYDFVERVLSNKELIDKQYIVEDRNLELRYENLVSRIAMRYGYKNIVRAGQDVGREWIDMLMLGTESNEWQDEMNKHLPLLKNEGAVIVKGIHKNTVNTEAWKKLYTACPVLLSIDTYGIGVLFFGKEFREKQHFVLKY